MIGACGLHVHAQTRRPSLTGWVCRDVGVEPAGADEHADAVDIDAPGQPGLVVSATLALADGSIAPREFRIGAPGAG